MWRSVTLIAAVGCAHALYYAWPEGSPRRWAAYVLGGLAFAIVCALHIPTKHQRSSEAGALALSGALWGILEGLQQFGCGVIGWGQVGKRDMCVEQFGAWPYTVAASLLVAHLFVIRLRPRTKP